MNNFVDLYDALKILNDITVKRNSKVINIEQAFGKTSCKTITSPFDLPDCNTSRMDGFAINSSISDFTKPFNVVDEIYAGEISSKTVKKNEAIKVATGAKLNDDIDMVVPFEYITYVDEKLFLTPQKNSYIQKKGSTIKKGDTIIEKNEIIDHRKIEILATLRINCVEVYRPVKIALISTGSELTEYFAKYTHILNSNYYMISSFLNNFDTEVTYLGIEKDDFESIKSKLKINIEDFDVLITIGGTGYSKADIIEDVVKSLGGKILINGINASPGKTFKFALIDEKPFFIIPGNPHSAIVCTELFIGFFLRGLSDKNLLIKTPVKFKLNKKQNFYKIIKSITVIEDDNLVSYDLYQYNNKGFRSLTIVDKNKTELNEGDLCDTFLLFYL
ncbi:molybdopterin molybdotransferase MoeA [Deferribacter autotrophicus]|uniref:Molybdopterin molybdenumtransferase n=1 Tax=Deferribacter autotrophicus TaxID=500465 RepID=A0A5A8F548_9BACT|nr:molybdopterin molybdotransferase MoeA [Deferribacter autotrophicus]KAA0258175.1 molybdopterin molybdotransferase MoeA [Deferribacter autotrophicus]